jgi:hypothetical protein
VMHTTVLTYTHIINGHGGIRISEFDPRHGGYSSSSRPKKKHPETLTLMKHPCLGVSQN